MPCIWVIFGTIAWILLLSVNCIFLFHCVQNTVKQMKIRLDSISEMWSFWDHLVDTVHCLQTVKFEGFVKLAVNQRVCLEDFFEYAVSEKLDSADFWISFRSRWIIIIWALYCHLSFYFCVQLSESCFITIYYQSNYSWGSVNSWSFMLAKNSDLLT